MSEPRHLNTDKSSRGAHAAPSGTRRHEAAPAAAENAAQSTAEPAAETPKRKSHLLRNVLLGLLGVVLVAVVAVAVAGGMYVNNVMEEIQPESDAASIAEEVMTAPEIQGDVMNILVCGIDYEEGRDYGTGTDGLENDGMTDMILYFQFDMKANKCNMLQIPRNSIVGSTYTTDAGNTYKASNGQINSIAKSNPEGIAALAEVINSMYKLPIDRYATIDMQSLTTIVDEFGGIDVYVPFDMSHDGSSLSKGYHTLDGASVEFLVRNRYGKGYETSDIARLNVQRYFYAALFKRIRTASLKELFKLTPHIIEYITTDMSVTDIVGLAYKFLSVPSSNITVAQTPVYAAASAYKGNSVVVPARDEIADLLNEYFRPYSDPVEGSDFNLFDWETTGSATSPSVQVMGAIDETVQEAIDNGEDDTYDYSDIINQAASEQGLEAGK